MASLASRVIFTTRPLSSDARLIRVLPGALLALLVLGGIWLIVSPDRRAAVVVATVATMVLYAAMLLPWRRWDARWEATLPLLGYLPIVAIDYAGTGMIFLAVIPVIWLALFSSRQVVLLALALSVLAVFVPRLLLPEAYPGADLLTMLTFAALTIIGGLALQSLVSGARAAVLTAEAANAQARADRDMVDAYLDNLGALVIVLDPQGHVLLFNRSMEEVTGARTEEVVGRLTWDPDDADDESRRSFERVLAGESPVINESDLPTLNGDFRRVLWNTTAVLDERGEVTRVLAVGQDVTAQRSAERATLEALERERQAAERLRELDAAKNDFVATVSHDLRTPLTSIIGNTELLLEGDAGELNRMQHRLTSAVDRNARRLDTLVGDLLLLSRVESGTMRMNLATVAMRDIVNGAREALESRWSPDVALEIHTPDEPALIRGDPDQLERVITNLLSNARKFTPPGGRVSVDIEPDEEQVRLRVADTGIGVPEDELAHIFDRFFRTSRSQRSNKPGSGLGLTIAKSIVELHHGTITASPNPGGGTVFTITLPRLVGAEEPAARR